MAKNKVSDWSSTASNNTDIGNINIAEGCAPSGINNAIRELMAQVRDMQTGADADGFTVGGAFTCSGAAVFSSTVALGSSATATTPSPNDNSTKIATTAYVDSLGRFADPGANGVVVRTASNVSTARTITAGTGISVTNGNGVSGNPTITNSGVTSVDGSTGAVTLSALSAFSKSLGSQGYQKFPGGFMIQWGTATLTTAGGQSITFPTEFPTNCFMVLGLRNAADSTGNLVYDTISRTGISDINPAAAGDYIWIAIGN